MNERKERERDRQIRRNRHIMNNSGLPNVQNYPTQVEFYVQSFQLRRTRENNSINLCDAFPRILPWKSRRNMDLWDPMIMDTTRYYYLSIVFTIIVPWINERSVSYDTVHHLVIAIVVVLFPSLYYPIILAGNQNMLHRWHSHRKNRDV